jgi:hypothetical protein
MKLSFDCSAEEWNMYERLSCITGMPKAEIIRRSVKEYAKHTLSEIFGADVKAVLIKTYGKDMQYAGKKE